jgi:type IV secretory pathway VirJ component
MWRMPRRLVRHVFGPVAVLAVSALAARAQSCDSAVVARLPVIERPADSPGTTLVLLMTGDGGWAKADERVAEGLQARGGAVIGLNMRTYLGHRRSPDEVAADVACLAAIYSIRWRRPRLMLLGYSRGADIAPFVASRLPSDLREALNMVALVSPSQRANFQFHLIDLIRDVHRDDDVPLLPEIEKLRGLNVLCIYGRSDGASLCTQLDASLARIVAREGGHRIVGGFDAMSDVPSEGLRNPKD